MLHSVAFRNGTIPGSSRWTSAPSAKKSSAPSPRIFSLPCISSLPARLEQGPHLTPPSPCRTKALRRRSEATSPPNGALQGLGATTRKKAPRHATVPPPALCVGGGDRGLF